VSVDPTRVDQEDPDNIVGVGSNLQSPSWRVKSRSTPSNPTMCPTEENVAGSQPPLTFDGALLVAVPAPAGGARALTPQHLDLREQRVGWKSCRGAA
jgi:hypothetical protein